MKNRLQKRFLIPTWVSLWTGIVILFYKGPGWKFFRFYVGDVVAVAFLYFLLSLFWRVPVYLRAGIIAAIAITIELAQFFQLTPKTSSFLSEIILGSQFEIWDFVAYGVGLAIAVGIDQWQLSMQR